jgi:hypothetical protein
LATTKKNQLSIFYYCAKMSQFAYELAASGTPLHDDELISYLLAGLDEEYNVVLTSVVARVDPIAPTELYIQLLSFEQHTNLQGHTSHDGPSSAMNVSRGRGYSGGRGSGSSSCGSGPGRGHTQRGGFSNQQGRSASNGSSSRPQCQVCSKIGHTAKTWWCCYDDDSNIESLTSGIAASTSTDNNWYTDSRVTYHITGELDKLMMHDVYCSNDQIHMANGLGVDITRIGKSIIPTPTHNLTLNNVLHVPSAHKILISIHHFTLDNDTFIEFHPFFFLIKDRKMKNVLLHGWCKGGLYPFPSSASRIQRRTPCYI